jgi:pimeloyl-ACP methyl ester carboxylesterase
VTRARALLAAVAVLLALPWLLRVEPRRLDEEARRRLPCSFVNMRDGRTCFDLDGPEDAETVVFVHGLTSPAYVWGTLPAMLRDAGYATLVYDLYGRGGSDRPWADYDLDLFDHQLETLLRKAGLTGSVHLVGLSMGGIIATEFALRHPELVADLTLLAPGGFRVEVPAAARLLTAPLVGDWTMQMFGGRFVASSHASLLFHKQRVGDLLRQFEPQFEFSGSRRALLSTLRRMPLADFTGRYAELGRSDLPVTVIWGRQDEVTPFSGATLAAELLPKASVRAIEDAGHLVHLDQPDLVMDAMLPSLRAVRANVQRGARRDVGQDLERGAPKPECRECVSKPVRPGGGEEGGPRRARGRRGGPPPRRGVGWLPSGGPAAGPPPRAPPPLAARKRSRPTERSTRLSSPHCPLAAGPAAAGLRGRFFLGSRSSGREGRPARMSQNRDVVGVAQSVEPRIVVPVVAGSSPVAHPTFPNAGGLVALPRGIG